MKREYEISGGPILVDGGTGLSMERDWGVARKVLIFSNGMVAAYDMDGDQIPEVQAPLLTLLDELYRHKKGEKC